MPSRQINEFSQKKGNRKNELVVRPAGPPNTYFIFRSFRPSLLPKYHINDITVLGYQSGPQSSQVDAWWWDAFQRSQEGCLNQCLPSRNLLLVSCGLLHQAGHLCGQVILGKSRQHCSGTRQGPMTHVLSTKFNSFNQAFWNAQKLMVKKLKIKPK